VKSKAGTLLNREGREIEMKKGREMRKEGRGKAF